MFFVVDFYLFFDFVVGSDDECDVNFWSGLIDEKCMARAIMIPYDMISFFLFRFRLVGEQNDWWWVKMSE